MTAFLGSALVKKLLFTRTMKNYKQFRSAFVLIGFLVSAVPDAAPAAETRPCRRGSAFVCDQAGCSCRRVPRGDTRWLVMTPDGSDDFIAGQGPTGWTCVPELHQCGCSGLLDCANLFLNLKVKCESFVCSSLGCICHFPNDIPAN